MEYSGDQSPQGVDEKRMREIARDEAAGALEVLQEVFASTPQRADGSVNARDFYDTLDLAIKQIRSKG